MASKLNISVSPSPLMGKTVNLVGVNDGQDRGTIMAVGYDPTLKSRDEKNLGSFVFLIECRGFLLPARADDCEVDWEEEE